MLARCAPEATCGIGAAADAAARPLALAVARSDTPSPARPATAARPLPSTLTAVSPPAATRATATTRPMSPRREGGNRTRRAGSAFCVPASPRRPLPGLWRTCPSLTSHRRW